MSKTYSCTYNTASMGSMTMGDYAVEGDFNPEQTAYELVDTSNPKTEVESIVISVNDNGSVEDHTFKCNHDENGGFTLEAI